jgi:hypothetical protein
VTARPIASLVLLLACTPRVDHPGRIEAPIEHVRSGHVFETTFDVADRSRDPDDVTLAVEFAAPSGKRTTIGGFWSEGRFHARFLPREAGSWSFLVRADGGAGEREVTRGAFVVDPASGPASGARLVRRDPKGPHRLVDEDGNPFYVLGENRINVYDPSWNEGKMSIEDYLAFEARHGMTTIRVFTWMDCKQVDDPKQRELGCLEPSVGRFDDEAARRFDRVFAAADAVGMHVVFTLYSIGFTPGPEEVWKSWNHNPYSAIVPTPVDFFVAPAMHAHHVRRLRYALDRWGAHPSLFALDLLNEPEWDGKIPETTWIPWAIRLAKEAHARDPYGHVVTAGPVGLKWNIEGDEGPWYRAPEDDLVQWHLYGKEYYEPHALAVEMTRKIEETWSFGKPVVCGEFAYGGEDKATYDHTHCGIWSALMSGAGALAHSAPPFEIDSDEPMTKERARHFEVLAKILHDAFGREGTTPIADVRVTANGPASGARAWSLVDDARAQRLIWLLGPEAGYGKEVVGMRAMFPAAPGVWSVEWRNDVTGETLARTSAPSEGTISIEAPPFARHVVAILRKDS